MRTYSKSWYGFAVAATVVLCVEPVTAQIDVNPPLPNVLLLVDTSGSMERMPDGSLPVNCTPGGVSDLNRWGTLASVLTGTVQDRSCYRQDRNSAAFINEFALGAVNPYDQKYKLPYHRLVSGECVVGAGVLPANPFDWPNGAIGYHKWDSTNACDPGEWVQEAGLLDSFRDEVRFGLMTFDPTLDPGTGESAGLPDYATGVAGTWSYFANWQGGGTPAEGNPPDCGLKLFEVGARNAAAPPWEGRMISMGPADATIAEIRTINERVQEALLAVRPYGATPLGGMMEDAYTFFFDDDSLDPLNPSEYFAPAKDPYFFEGCRKNFVVVLSDGEPNLDLRPDCETGTGTCPFRLPYEVAHELANPANPEHAIQTFAVGFGLSAGAGFDCTLLQMPNDFDSGGMCDGATGSLEACCNLARIAYEGGTERAYFADDPLTLKSALSQVFALISSGSTSRTLPSFASGTAAAPSGAPAKSYEFVSSFEPVTDSGLWEGNLERKRWKCENTVNGLEAILQTIDLSKGDDFAANVNQGKLTQPRRFLTVVGDPVGGTIHSRRSIRPHLSGTDDGLGTYSGSVADGDVAGVAGEMQSNPEAMGLVPAPADCSSEQLQAGSSSECALRVMRWALGGSNGATLPSRSGAEFGAIYHSSPVVHGKPSAFLRDEAYSLFSSNESLRPLMLYTATVDGQLHAFKVASNDPAETTVLADSLENNELWSFLPPYVLPGLMGMYPESHQILLDGAPVIQDVVFERTEAQAIAGSGVGAAQWSTVIVAGGGSASFYYALDVTDPYSPVFLWQLSTDATGNALFGDRAGTPAIATVAMEENGVLQEIAVAVLPGGDGQLDANPACQQARQANNFLHIDATYQPRGQVRCWADGAARSLTIVRLRDGKVLATFRGDAANDGDATISGGLIRQADFDSPITGIPVPYPSRTGQLADRIYVGDADGTLWRIDLGSPDPLDWDAEIAFDAYSLGTDGYDDGQPVAVPPVVAVDGQGNTVVLFATGDQQQFHTATGGMKTRVWSLLERPEAVGLVPFKMDVNWLIPFADGKRVTGPIAVFDEVAYFATFTPESGGNVCVDGYGSIWGVDYVESEISGSGPYPVARLADDPNANPITYVHEKQEDPGVVVFGVAVTQTPSCYETAEVIDAYSGTHTAITASSPPTYQLVYQTGTGGQATEGARTRTKTQLLPQLSEMARIDSWASIIE